MNPIVDHARDTLEAAGLEVQEVRELPTGHGWQVRCAGGEMVCAYRTGKLVAQGKNAVMVKALLDKAGAAPKTVAAVKPGKAAAAVEAPAVEVPSAAGGGDAAGEFKPRLPPGWTTEPWDGVTPPW